MGNKNLQRPLLSIIVPSRNRVEYAKWCIRSILTIRSDKLELVVADNSDNHDLKSFINVNIQDDRLKYFYSAEPVSVIDNFERAVLHSSGEYITFLGDDDGVNPGVIEATMWMKNQRLDALISELAYYWWPDHRFYYEFNQGSGGMLDILSYSGKVSFPDSQKEMIRCAMASGAVFYDLPKIYRGIVRRECMDMVKQKTGVYFPGPSPDLAGAMAVANYVEKMCKIDYPLFIPGSSAKSTAGLGAIKKHIGKLEDQPHLPKRCIQNWSNIVPKFFSGNTIWAEDVVQALRAIERHDILSHFNVPRLHAMCTVFNYKYAETTLRNFHKAVGLTGGNYLSDYARFIYYYFHVWGKRASFLAARLKLPNSKSSYGKRITIDNVNNIKEAVDLLVTHTNNEGLKLCEIL